SDVAGWNLDRYFSTIQYPDVNGDGKADLCARAGDRIWCYIGTGAGFTTVIAGPELSDALGYGFGPQYYSTIQYPDLNGDGKADVCVRSGVGILCWLSTGTGFGNTIVGPEFSDAGSWNLERYYSTIQYPD